ncbi:ATP-binding integral membrane protein [Streptomyces albus]|uniref:ATP-binding integral membrane protein n=1 Tax=Streptomyces albus (strain ATCC 21838 / DSM 41398 / FERM P-419 / JCM 4703 / NBRC 107858) TaxID=1081613 RepID=A0A0B5EX99_STRA4|nr:ATP-binding integral membrane protein [Streptomyces albus]AOU81741.1 ATP-binding integral membrane protein [Streptomyces albus]AYN37431.1 ATP-binding protein [Streptomyces albus]
MGFCDLPLADKVCDAGGAVSDAADFAANPGKAIGDWMAKSAGELAAAAADLAAEGVDSTTKVDLRAAYFVDNYELLLPIGLTLLVATFCAQLIRAAVRRDGQALTQAFTGTVSGVLFSFAALACTTVAIEVVDALSDGLFAAADLSIETAVRRVVKMTSIVALTPLGWLVTVVAGLGSAVGAFMYWAVMMVRKVGILVLVTLAVFAGAGGGWEVARRWRRGWIEATATLVVSKLLMTIIFVLGVSAMGKTHAKDGTAALADVMSGIVILTLVLLTPYATFKFVHWAAEGTDADSLHRAGGAGAQMARQHAERAARKTAGAVATAGTGGAAAAAGATGAGGFPGDIAAHPTGPSPDSKSNPHDGGTSGSPGVDAAKAGLDKALHPPTGSEDSGGQVDGAAGPGLGASAASGRGGGWQSTPPTTSPPPQGPPPPSGSPHTTTGGTGGAPPPTGR